VCTVEIHSMLHVLSEMEGRMKRSMWQSSASSLAIQRLLLCYCLGRWYVLPLSVQLQRNTRSSCMRIMYITCALVVLQL
jgi:hypothetical protein